MSTVQMVDTFWKFRWHQALGILPNLLGSRRREYFVETSHKGCDFSNLFLGGPLFLLENILNLRDPSPSRHTLLGWVFHQQPCRWHYLWGCMSQATVALLLPLLPLHLAPWNYPVLVVSFTFLTWMALLAELFSMTQGSPLESPHQTGWLLELPWQPSKYQHVWKPERINRNSRVKT